MRLGIFAKTFPGSDPFMVLTAARQAGYDAVQYNMACSGLPSMPDSLPESTVPALVAAARGAGVTLAAVSGTYNMIHPDPAQHGHPMHRQPGCGGSMAPPPRQPDA
jgi:sugar phosphate isomerase/epimerase